MNPLCKAQAGWRTAFGTAVGAAMTALCLTVSSVALAQDPIVMKLGHTLAPDNHYQLSAEVFAREVAQRTQGRYKIELFPQSQLGGEVQMTEALRTGTQDLMISAQAPLDNTIKQWQIFDLPYLFSTMDEANGTLQGPVGRKYLAMMQPVNMVGLAWLAVGERNLFTTRRPITTLADMKDLKVRVMQSPGYIAGYKALGANPTPLAYNQVFLGLSQGLVDGADTSPEQFVQDKFSDVAKHFYVTHMNYMPVVLAMSKSAWSKLSPADQKAFMDAANVAAQFDLKEYKREYDAAFATMKKDGIQVSSVDTQPWVAATQAARNELIGKIPDGKALYDEINAAKHTASVASK